MKDRETLAYAIAVYGREAQITKAVEELAELSAGKGKEDDGETGDLHT